MGKTAIMKIMERACGHEVKIGDRVWCHVDLASARDFGGANCVLQFEKEMGKDARVWDPDKIAYTFDLQAPSHSEKVSNNQKIIREFAKRVPDVHVIVCRSTMRMRDLLDSIAESIGVSASGSNDERVRRIQRELAANRDTMLIFDEADHLYGWDVKKFEIIRQLWDETNTPIVLVGPPRLEEILTHGSGRSNLSQLYRRKYEIKLTGIKPDEVRAILAQYDVEPRVAAELTLIATDTRHGGMGNFIEIFGMCLEAAVGGTVTQEILAGAKCYKLQG